MGTIEEEVSWIKQWINNQLQNIRTLSYVPFRVLLYVTIIEGFAQHAAKYPKYQNANHFSDFVLEYCGSLRDILDEICPVTLYYDCKDNYDFGMLKLQHSRIYSAGDNDLIDEALRLSNMLPADKRGNLTKKHKYVYLIYAMRNKVAHELNNINSPINFQEDRAYQVPHISTRSKFGQDEKTGSKCIIFDAWVLNIPVQFIENLLVETTSNYLKMCLDKHVLPFGNHSDKRKCQLAWYD